MRCTLFSAAITLAFSLLAGNVYAQWELLYPDIPSDRINDIVFLNSSTGFAVNAGGCILMTTDGGGSWKIRAHYQRADFSEIHFLDDKNGFAVSPYTQLSGNVSFVYTTDGGFQWSEGNVIMGSALAFLPLSSSEIIRANAFGIIEKLDNFFGLWRTTFVLPTFMNDDVREPCGDIVRFEHLPGGRILALGSNDRAKRAGVLSDSVTFVLRSDDTGNTWTYLWQGLTEGSQSFTFVNDSIGWLGTDSSGIYKTTDGGVSWNLQYAGFSEGFPIKSISSPDGGFVAAVDGSGRVLVSDNGGQSWTTQQVVRYYNYPFVIRFLNPQKGFLGGPVFLETTDGGTNWRRVSKSLAGTFWKIDFASETLGMAVGDSSIYRTRDGGRSWSILYRSPSQTFRGLDMVDSMNIWATSNNLVYHSTDGGASWTSRSLNSSVIQIRGIQFLDSQTGVVYEVWDSDSTFNYVTTDGGSTWNKYTINGLQHFSSYRKVKFTDPEHLWLANQYGTWLSRDTARSWTLFPLDGAFDAFDFVDSLTGWIGIWRGLFKQVGFTSDGGSSWELMNRPYSSQPEDMIAFRAYGTPRMFVAGYDGSLNEFTQGDSYVYDIPTFTANPLHSFAAYRRGGAIHFWVAGDGMTVLHTWEVVTSIHDQPGNEPVSFKLDQNYPNPFNPTTVVSFQLPVGGVIRLAVFDVLGREVTVLASGRYLAGRYSIAFDGSKCASGVYFCRLAAGGKVLVKKMTLIR